MTKATLSGKQPRTALSIKRGGDLVGASCLLMALAPIMAVSSITILAVDGGPLLFRQWRPGRYGIAFSMTKLRTMRAPDPDEVMWTTDSDRVTAVGRWLRQTGFDELPELINVLRGDMSLVGPRPLLIEYLDKYSPAHARRHAMRPGITGLAQVSGRRGLSMSQRLDLDVAYVDNWSLALDVKILIRTLATPFRQGPGEHQSIAEVDDLGLLEGVARAR